MHTFNFATDWWQFVVMAVASYFIGCFNFAVIISKLKKKDITKIGSGNPGTMNMSREFGEKIDETHYAFPTAEALYNAGVDKIFELKTGFRAKYIYDAAEKVVTGKIDLSAVDKMTTEEALEYFMQIKGVGLKVASCALLFGFNKTDAFPVDVWVKRVLEKYYPDGLDLTNLGAYAGMIQQYLFYYERYNK